MQRATSSAVEKSSVTPRTSCPSLVWSTKRWVSSCSVDASIRSKIQCSFSMRTSAGTSVNGPICSPIRCARDVREAKSWTGRQSRWRNGMRNFRRGSTPARKARAIRVPSLKSEDFSCRFAGVLLKCAYLQGLNPLIPLRCAEVHVDTKPWQTPWLKSHFQRPKTAIA